MSILLLRSIQQIERIPNLYLIALPLILPILLLCRIIYINHHTNIATGDDDTTTTITNSNKNNNSIQYIYVYSIIAMIGYIVTSKLIPHIAQYTLRKNIYGKDLGKRNTARADIPIPEALGIVPGAVFLVCLIFCLTTITSIIISTTSSTISSSSSSPTLLSSPSDATTTTTSTIHYENHPHHLLYKYILEINTSLLAICFMIFLGFTDDVLDWPWRYKLLLPSIASLPLLCCYTGSTTIVVPIPLRSVLYNTSSNTFTTFGSIIQDYIPFITIDFYSSGSLIDLSYIYLLYMGMLAVFCTNAINIYAGINGLEAGQSYIIACFILFYNCIEILSNPNYSNSNNQNIENHTFSIMILLCFIAVTLGILQHNWYPASIFVGDTYCYFAGMTFAVVGIFGHYSKTLLLFFIPQIINFIWSVPQLFHIVPCPRHRLPYYNSNTDCMEPSTFTCKEHDYQWLKYINRCIRSSKLSSSTTNIQTEIPNMTVINLTLQILGPMHERTLCISLLVLQIICCTIGFVIRYYISQFFF